MRGREEEGVYVCTCVCVLLFLYVYESVCACVMTFVCVCVCVWGVCVWGGECVYVSVWAGGRDRRNVRLRERESGNKDSACEGGRGSVKRSARKKCM